MTSTELPQLSLQRYVDLVRRRRWQLIPVSLLGLLVGGLIAFFVPRYYVAVTTLEHQPVGDTSALEDPFARIVASAQQTIPLAAGDVLDKLKWPELDGLDEFEREQYERQVEERITVRQLGGGDRNRSYTQLVVEYRDRDGQRAADFVNELVAQWIPGRIDQIRQPKQQQKEAARKRELDALATLRTLRAEMNDIALEYELDPTLASADSTGGRDPLGEVLVELQKELRDAQAAAQKQRSIVRQLEERLEGIEPRIPQDTKGLEKIAQDNPAAKQLLYYIVRAQTGLLMFRPGTSLHANAKRELERNQAMLQQILPSAAISPDGMVANPDYAEARRKLIDAQAELGRLERQAQDLALRVEAQEQRMMKRIKGLGLYLGKAQEEQSAKAQHDAAAAERREADRAYIDLTREPPVTRRAIAQVPPAPTEPNILVVALIGCVLGLGAAIGLILAFDFLQGTFKTVDDVERGLSVPVLGGVSHLETTEERLTLRRGRRKATFVAATALVLITVVVTIFYWDPTRLPAGVRDVLAMLLGN